MDYRKINFTKVSPSVSKASRRFFDNHVRRAFVQYVAYVGLFDGVLTEQEVEDAKDGILPPDLDIHHIVPLSGSMSTDVNAFTNLTILHKSTHIHINRKKISIRHRIPKLFCSWYMISWFHLSISLFH